MIVGVGQLRQAVKLLGFSSRAGINAGIKIDQMLAGNSRVFEIDNDVTLAVEAAGVKRTQPPEMGQKKAGPMNGTGRFSW